MAAKNSLFLQPPCKMHGCKVVVFASGECARKDCRAQLDFLPLFSENALLRALEGKFG